MINTSLNTSDGVFWGSILILSLALSVDSLCASAINATDERVKNKRILFIFIAALTFGLFHFIMPVIGYFFGSLFVEQIQAYTKWISFGILLFIGLKGIGEQLFDIHVDKMEKLAKSVDFDGEKYIRKLVAEGKDLKEIKREYKELGKKLKRDEEHGIEQLKYEDHRKCKALGVYLIHETKYLNKKRLEEIIHPESKEQKKEGKLIASFLVSLLLQALATSLDALAVGFSYVGQLDWSLALCIFGVFFAVIFLMCLLGGFLGKIFGEKYQRIANLLGSLVLMVLGILALF